MTKQEIITALKICSGMNNHSCRGCPMKEKKMAYCVKVLLGECLKLLTNNQE